MRPVVFVFCILLVLPTVVSASITHTSREERIVHPRLLYHYINATSLYDYGWKAGIRLRPLYQLLFSLTSTPATGIDTSATRKNGCQTQVKYSDDVQGLADSLHIQPERLLRLQRLLYSYTKDCTVILATGKATLENTTFLAQNFDTKVGTPQARMGTFLTRLTGWLCYVVRINTMRYRYVMFGLPVLFEVPLFNEAGLGFGEPGTSFVNNSSNRTVDSGPGISTYELDRLTLMICKNVSEAATLRETSERACEKNSSFLNRWDGSTPCYCDKDGGIVAIEQTHSYIISVFGNDIHITGAPEGILWHANHHQWLDPNKTGSKFPDECLNSQLRAERAVQLLTDNYGTITLDTIKTIMADWKGGTNHSGKDSADICRHPDANESAVTALSWIIEPQTYTVYLAHRSPDASQYIPYNFTTLFEK